MIYLLPHTILTAAERNPEQDAFRSGNRSYTYADLVQKMNQLAGLLVESGVKRGDRVGVYMNRSLETALAIYGIMHAGAAYVPLDPHAPAARTRFLIQDCEIRHLITHPSQRRTLPDILQAGSNLKSLIGVGGEWPVRSVSWEEVYALPATSPDVRVLENDLAYIMYTSGSTGAPKGIMHTHYSGLNYARLSADLYGLSPADIVGNHAPLHFDISTLGYFSTPLAGATTVIVSDAHTKMPASLTQLMEDERMTVWYSVPLALIQMLQRGVLEERDLSALRWVLYGGEPFPAKHLRALMELWPHTRFCNVYGPAEVNQCTYYHLPGPPQGDEPIPLGDIWDNTEMLILDADDQPIAPGEMGELLIRTVTMMRGYWRQPELTQKGLYKRVRIPGNEETFYRTGDLVRQDKNGNLHFMGRKDRQIKTRGYRVELDEVEAALVALEAVEEAAVFAVPNELEGLLIEAAVILKKDATATELTLRNEIGASLPSYAVPYRIHIFDELPRTSSGKINRLHLQQYVSKISHT